MDRRDFFKFLGKGIVVGTVVTTIGLPEFTKEKTKANSKKLYLTDGKETIDLSGEKISIPAGFPSDSFYFPSHYNPEYLNEVLKLTQNRFDKLAVSTKKASVAMTIYNDKIQSIKS